MENYKMVSKILKFMVGFIIIFLLFGIVVQYYACQPVESKELLCHKGKLLQRIGEDGNVYTKVKGLSCEYEKSMLIIEEKS